MYRAIRTVLFLLPAALPAYAQSDPGTRISAEVTTVSIARTGAVTQVDYVVHNLPASEERLLALTIEAPAAPLVASSPTPAESWDNSLQYGDRPVVRWVALNDSILVPGASSQVLWFRANGLPAIVPAHVEGYYDLPLMSEDDPEAENPGDPLISNSVALRVVGVEPVPSGANPSSLTSRLDDLTGEACSLGWIPQAGLCTILRGHLTAQPARLTSFRDDLAAGHTAGGPVSDNAYWLLKVNADYIISLAPPSPATPALTWVPPGPMVFGTALSGTQLNASATGTDGANLSGTFAYSPAGGTILSPGNQTLSTAFTPTDGSTYTAATKSVSVDVRYTTATGHRFLQPINVPPQQRSVFKLGSTIPVKFQLFRADGTTLVSNATATIQVNRVSNGAPDPVNETVSSTVPDQGTRFRYTGSQYIFNLGTANLATGTYRLSAILDDGSSIVQDVELRSN